MAQTRREERESKTGYPGGIHFINYGYSFGISYSKYKLKGKTEFVVVPEIRVENLSMLAGLQIAIVQL